jgi:hypothetical protein
MPYINSSGRFICDSIVNTMNKCNMQINGDLNYILFKYCKYHIIPSYNNYKNYIGELEETIAEIRRKILAPYEDSKIQENGDV